MALFLAAEMCFLALMAVAGPALSLEFFPWALSMEVVTFVLYLCYYVYQKLLSNESIPNWLVLMVVANLALWLMAFRLYAVKVLDYRRGSVAVACSARFTCAIIYMDTCRVFMFFFFSHYVFTVHTPVLVLSSCTQCCSTYGVYNNTKWVNGRSPSDPYEFDQSHALTLLYTSCGQRGHPGVT